MLFRTKGQSIADWPLVYLLLALVGAYGFGRSGLPGAGLGAGLKCVEQAGGVGAAEAGAGIPAGTG